MASKTPFLTTDVGNAREIIGWSHAGELLPTIKDSRGYSQVDIVGSVRVLEAFCSNKEQRTRMQEAGYQAWTEKFDWERIAQSYETVYENLLDAGGP